MPRTLFRLAALIVGSAAGAAPAAAQMVADVIPAAHAPRCLASTRVGGLTQVIASVIASIPDTTAALAGSTTALVAQSVAERLREILGATRDSLPRGAPAITWHDLKGSIAVTVHRADLRMEWRVDSAPGTFGSPTAIGLLERALFESRTSGELAFVWPDSLESDSVRFKLRFVRPFIDHEGTLVPHGFPMAFAAFTVDVPREALPVPRGSAPRYPARARAAGAEGGVRLRFLVDSGGGVAASSVSEVWPPDQLRPTGKLAEFYADFLDAATRVVVREGFEPGRVGDCRVTQWLEMQFEFKLQR